MDNLVGYASDEELAEVPHCSKMSNTSESFTKDSHRAAFNIVTDANYDVIGMEESDEESEEDEKRESSNKDDSSDGKSSSDMEVEEETEDSSSSNSSPKRIRRMKKKIPIRDKNYYRLIYRILARRNKAIYNRQLRHFLKRFRMAAKRLENRRQYQKRRKIWERLKKEKVAHKNLKKITYEVVTLDEEESPSDESEATPKSLSGTREVENYISNPRKNDSWNCKAYRRDQVSSTSQAYSSSFYTDKRMSAAEKLLQQIEQRKKLWTNKVSVNQSDSSKVWESATFENDNDGRMTQKFKRLMGIRTESPGGSSGSRIVEEVDLNKRQEMFSNMEAQYQAARLATHTNRGLGLGFGTPR